MTLKRGFVQIFTGNGKGKTSAAIGLAVRAAGAGLRTYFLQIMKNYPYSELNSLKKFKGSISLVQAGNDDFVIEKRNPTEKEKEIISSQLEKIILLMKNRNYDIFILDEICVAIHFGLIEIEKVIELLEIKPENVELVLTGRYCPQNLIEKADLVTRMEEVKHYYANGVFSRKGIDS